MHNQITQYVGKSTACEPTSNNSGTKLHPAKHKNHPKEQNTSKKDNDARHMNSAGRSTATRHEKRHAGLRTG